MDTLKYHSHNEIKHLYESYHIIYMSKPMSEFRGVSLPYI